MKRSDILPAGVKETHSPDGGGIALWRRGLLLWVSRRAAMVAEPWLIVLSALSRWRWRPPSAESHHADGALRTGVTQSKHDETHRVWADACARRVLLFWGMGIE